MTTDRIRTRVVGRVGRLTLDRPEALNALDLDMIRALRAALDRWADDDRVDLVVLDGAGTRGFCAGGDVIALRRQILLDDLDPVRTFFEEEYALDARLAGWPKPVVTIADGVTMGGGIGLASHARVRVVTERSRLTMPEIRIGFVPDVGGSLLLARAPGRLGEYLTLTGASVSGADAVRLGFADRLVRSSAIEQVVRRLEDGASVEEAFDGTEAPPVDDGSILDDRAWIDDAFSATTVQEVLDRLRADPRPAPQRTAEALAASSPTALVVALAALRRARELDDLAAVLEQDLHLATWFAATRPDMPEGIGARLVDRGRTPSWSPARLADVHPGVFEDALRF